MSIPTIKIHNLETNKIIEREMNDEEFAQYKIDLAQKQVQAQVQAEAQVKRQALLDKLGITEEEARLLLN